MKIGFDHYSYHRYFGEIYGAHESPGLIWTLEDCINHTQILPFECLALETCFLPTSEHELADAIKKVDQEFAFAWGHPNGFMDKDENIAIAEIEKYLRLSQIYNCRVLRIVGSSIAYFQLPHQPQIDLILHRLDRIVPLAEKYRVNLAIENHGDFFLSEFKEIINKFDSEFFGMTLDTGNLLRFNEDPVDAIREMGQKIFLVHAKDLALKKGFSLDDPQRLACVPAGKGITDFPGIIKELKAQNYIGMVLIEISGVHPNYATVHETDMIQEGILYLKSLRNRL